MTFLPLNYLTSDEELESCTEQDELLSEDKSEDFQKEDAGSNPRNDVTRQYKVDKKFPCDDCDQKYSTKQSLKFHRRREHLQVSADDGESIPKPKKSKRHRKFILQP